MQIDSKMITKIATGEIDGKGESLLKVWCKKEKVPRIVNETAAAMVSNTTGVPTTAAAAGTTLSGLNMTTTGYPKWNLTYTPTQGIPDVNSTTAMASTTVMAGTTEDVAGPVTEMVEFGVEKCKYCSLSERYAHSSPRGI